MEPHELEHLSLEEKKAFFRKATIMHRQLEQAHRTILRAARESAEAVLKPARGRRKKRALPAVETTGAEGKSPSSQNGNAPSIPTDPETVALPAKPKRTRRVGEPKPKRYPVGEQERELS